VAHVEWLVRVGDVGAVQHQLHDEDAVLFLLEAVDFVFLARAERPRVVRIHLYENLDACMYTRSC